MKVYCKTCFYYRKWTWACAKYLKTVVVEEGGPIKPEKRYLKYTSVHLHNKKNDCSSFKKASLLRRAGRCFIESGGRNNYI